MTTMIPAVIIYTTESDLNQGNQNQKNTRSDLSTPDSGGINWLNAPTHSSKSEVNNYDPEQLPTADGIFPIH